MQVRALRNSDGTFRGKFHRHDAYDCAGRRMYEENYVDKDDYVLVDLAELPDHQGACQFECCFKGLADAAAVAGPYAEGRTRRRATSVAAESPQPRGIVTGQQVEYRDFASGETKRLAIIGGRRADPSKDEISPETPIARALIGCEVGDVVRIDLPKGSRRVEILAVQDPS